MELLTPVRHQLPPVLDKTAIIIGAKEQPKGQRVPFWSRTRHQDAAQGQLRASMRLRGGSVVHPCLRSQSCSRACYDAAWAGWGGAQRTAPHTSVFAVG